MGDNTSQNPCTLVSEDSSKENNNSISEVVYPKFVPYFSNRDVFDEDPVHRGLFDTRDEELQQSHGKAPWDEYGWSRDGWVI